MAKIQYTKTSFVEPDQISETLFHQLKKELSGNPNFEYAEEGESFLNYFKGHFQTLGITLGGGLVVNLIGSIFDGTWVAAIFYIIGFLLTAAGVIFLITFFAEAPSYAKYKRQRRSYFERMKIAILESENYSEFVSLFYY